MLKLGQDAAPPGRELEQTHRPVVVPVEHLPEVAEFQLQQHLTAVSAQGHLPDVVAALRVPAAAEGADLVAVGSHDVLEERRLRRLLAMSDVPRPLLAPLGEDLGQLLEGPGLPRPRREAGRLPTGALRTGGPGPPRAVHALGALQVLPGQLVPPVLHARDLHLPHLALAAPRVGLQEQHALPRDVPLVPAVAALVHLPQVRVVLREAVGAAAVEEVLAEDPAPALRVQRPEHLHGRAEGHPDPLLELVHHLRPLRVDHGQ
mmetsp:Transcript_65205/g.176230  ORF Transcript_65205/g.176230 Transcript_65205/m.176230 type:complete len:261 (+) Transcript_65205:856-1638(+)